MEKNRSFSDLKKENELLRAESNKWRKEYSAAMGECYTIKGDRAWGRFSSLLMICVAFGAMRSCHKSQNNMQKLFQKPAVPQHVEEVPGDDKAKEEKTACDKLGINYDMFVKMKKQFQK